tara:strand:+ start:5722 stop:6330 length:609 start_codon:yes stop_codon:yes gene_type:complete
MKEKKKQTLRKSARTIVITLTMALFLSPGIAGAQGMPVYDNVNFISFAKQLLEAGKQTSNIIKTMKFLKEQKENIDKVNYVIKQLKAVKELAKNNQRLYAVVQNDLKEILNSPFIKPEEVNRISDSFNAILQNATAGMEFVDQILSSDHMKMTDAERAEVLKEQELQSKEMVSEIEQKTRRYREIIQFREMQHKINYREGDY